MSLTDKSVTDLLAAFRDPTPTPGGGSASALSAAVGVSLLVMVAAMGRTRRGDDEDRRVLDQAAEALLPIADHLEQLVDDDAAAYEEVMDAYRLPKGTEDDKTARRIAVQSALRGAAEVPLDMMRACQAALTAAVDVARHGNPAAASDVGVAMELVCAGLRGAALNVRVNLEGVTDDGWAGGAREEIERLEAVAPLLSSDVKAALTG